MLPLCLLIALAVKIDSRGPVLYRQTRLGRRGRPFTAFKFRSMVKNADETLQDYLARHSDRRKEWNATQKLKHDPRITRIGRFLRRTSLDELPQLLNVLRGEMSLVGPRPCMPDQACLYDWVWEFYKRVRPGITGQWQISGRNRLSFKERTMMNAYYIRNWSVWLDLYILIKTIPIVVRGDGAY
jgi:Undecaprenyl-phosphate galactose phosphotransferase WbaP